MIQGVCSRRLWASTSFVVCSCRLCHGRFRRMLLPSHKSRLLSLSSRYLRTLYSPPSSNITYSRYLRTLYTPTVFEYYILPLSSNVTYSRHLRTVYIPANFKFYVLPLSSNIIYFRHLRRLHPVALFERIITCRRLLPPSSNVVYFRYLWVQNHLISSTPAVFEHSYPWRRLLPPSSNVVLLTLAFSLISQRLSIYCSTSCFLARTHLRSSRFFLLFVPFVSYFSSPLSLLAFCVFRFFLVFISFVSSCLSSLKFLRTSYIFGELTFYLSSILCTFWVILCASSIILHNFSSILSTIS